MKSINFVYCLDSNYNIQFLVSVYSLLQKVSNKINIFVLHPDPDSLSENIDKIKSHINCDSVIIKKIDESNFKFPKTSNSHVSNATYYRLFIPLLLDNLDFVIYLDSDTVVLNNPIPEFITTIDKMKNEKLLLAAVLETDRFKSKDIFNRLELNGSDYFNAGVFVMNIRQFNLMYNKNSLLHCMNQISYKIKMWDQDVLNYFFDCKWYQINKTLNFQLDLTLDSIKIDKKIKIIHYVGSKKPWIFEGLVKIESKYFQKIYLELFDKKFYYLKTNWKKNTFKELIFYLTDLKNYKIKNFKKIILSTIKLLIKS